MLKLIINNSDIVHRDESDAKQTAPDPSLQDSFLADFQEFSPNLYVLIAKDSGHELTCQMTLELKESFVYLDEERKEGYLVPVMACCFPSLDVQKFSEKVGWDNYLQGILMFQFQLKILEQLFLFCEEKDAV